MDFELSDWKSTRLLNELLGRGSPHTEVVDFCRDAIAQATQAGRESERIYLSGRLADILVGKGQFDAAAEVYGRMWPGTITPALYGLKYVKLLLRRDKQQEASGVLQEMQVRLRKATDAVRGPSPFDQLAVLLAEGLLEVRRGNKQPLQRICADIVALAQYLPWVPYVDTEFLDALVFAQEYELARQMLDFIATVRPRKR